MSGEGTPDDRVKKGSLTHRLPQNALPLLFSCCDPGLTVDLQVAVTLHRVCGLSTAEIARAFLLSKATVARRLSDCEAKIGRQAPWTSVPDGILVERLEAVLLVVYLLFNEGYSATDGSSLLRTELCDEAIRIGRCLKDCLPAAPEVNGLLGLMLVQDARRSGRTDEHGDLVPLEEQDRRLWDYEQIMEGSALVREALTGNSRGKYALQAGIAALHALAPSPEETHWAKIALLYQELSEIDPTPIVQLNRAIAVAMAEGIEEGLKLLNGISLPGYHLVPAARADLLRRLGRSREAADAYRSALDLVTNRVERRYLERRLTEQQKAS